MTLTRRTKGTSEDWGLTAVISNEAAGGKLNSANRAQGAHAKTSIIFHVELKDAKCGWRP